MQQKKRLLTLFGIGSISNKTVGKKSKWKIFFEFQN